MTARHLYELNKVPGVLGCAWLCEGEEVTDFGEAIGGAEAIGLARKVVGAAAAWKAGGDGEDLESAVFVGEAGRILLQPAGQGMLVAFAENDTSAGLLRVKMRETSTLIGESTAH